MIREPSLPVERSESGDRGRLDVTRGQDPLHEIGRRVGGFTRHAGRYRGGFEPEPAFDDRVARRAAPERRPLGLGIRRDGGGDFVEHVEIDHPWWPAASGPAQLRPVPPCVSQEHGEQDCHADQEDDEQADPDGRRNLPRFRLHRGRRHHRVRCGRRDRGSGAAEIGTFGELHASGRGHGHEQHRHDRAGQRREHRPSIHRRNVLPRSDRADRPIRARRAGRCSAARSLPRHARRGRSPRRS